MVAAIELGIATVVGGEANAKFVLQEVTGISIALVVLDSDAALLTPQDTNSIAALRTSPFAVRRFCS
jgi:hypothetical protein